MKHLFCVNRALCNKKRTVGSGSTLHRRRRHCKFHFWHVTAAIKGGEGAPRGPWCVFLSSGRHPSSRTRSPFLVLAAVFSQIAAGPSGFSCLSLLPLGDFPRPFRSCVVSTQWPAATWQGQRGLTSPFAGQERAWSRFLLRLRPKASRKYRVRLLITRIFPNHKRGEMMLPIETVRGINKGKCLIASFKLSKIKERATGGTWNVNCKKK